MDLQALYEPFPREVEKTLKKGGASLTYIPVSEVITRMNKVFGIGGWTSQIMACARDQLDPDFIVAHVRIEATIDGTMVWKDGIGGQKIKRTKNGDIVDLGDEFKGAVSDALKKAAQQFGIGLYLARSEEALALDEEETKPEIDPAVLDAWERFLGIAKSLDDTCCTFWTKSARCSCSSFIVMPAATERSASTNLPSTRSFRASGTIVRWPNVCAAMAMASASGFTRT